MKNDALEMWDELAKNSEGTLKQCVYMGTKVVADTMKDRLKSIKTQADNKRTDVRYPYEYEKQVLLDNMGVSPMSSSEKVTTKVGFDGYYYNKQETRKPIPLLANSVNAGTTFLKKQDFINATKRQAETPCRQAMQSELDKLIKS